MVLFDPREFSSCIFHDAMVGRQEQAQVLVESSQKRWDEAGHMYGNSSQVSPTEKKKKGKPHSGLNKCQEN